MQMSEIMQTTEKHLTSKERRHLRQSNAKFGVVEMNKHARIDVTMLQST